MNNAVTHQKVGVDMKRARGFALLDVLLAIVIFAVGMLALASLQTNLTRSSVDSNARMVAVNFGEEIIERMRSFERVSTDPDGLVLAFADIDKDYAEAFSQERGGLNYTVTATVWGYNFNDEGTDVETPVVAVAGTDYDFKKVDLTVAWDVSAEFQVDKETTVAAGDMNSGEVTVEGIVSSIPAFSTASVAAESENLGDVPVTYTPGARPDIIPLSVEDGKLKESTTPLPTILKSDSSTQTWFDVITYNGANNQFVRREEFLVVSCECKLQTPSGNEGGFLPTIWNGKEYVTGPELQGDAYVERDKFVSKLYGESTSNTPGVDYCVTCCRDHHDDAEYSSADEVYDPARLEDPDKAWTTEATGASGDHAHYSRSKKGDLKEVAIGGTYVEACRMVRKDGFMRVAQDFRQEGFLAFPEGFLDTANGGDAYSEYVVKAVDDFEGAPRDELVGPDGKVGTGPVLWTYNFPGTESDPTELPFLGSINSQQMRSRGIYIDHLGAEAQATVDCLKDNEGEENIAEICKTPGMNHYLQAYPFFEVQTTFLSWWNDEERDGFPVSVTNEAAKTDNAHSRGKANLVSQTEKDDVTVITEMHRGNSGLSVTDPISLLDEQPIARDDAEVYVKANEFGTTGSSPAAYYWSGTFESAVNGVNAADSDLVLPENGNTYCARNGTAISCLTSIDAGGGSSGGLTISGYYKNAGTSLYICVANFAGASTVNNSLFNALDKEASFTWNLTANVSNVQVSIEQDPCP